MTRRSIVALAEREGDGGWLVRAPAVGIWSEIPRDGIGVHGGNVGLLSQGNHRLALWIPDHVGGTVSGSPADRRRSVAVEWGQILFRLVHGGGFAAETASEPEEREGSGGLVELRSPTDGVFYHRPTPSAAPFVAAGDTIRLEQAIGLVEVMKTFTQVLYEGHGLPDPAVIEQLLVGDGVEVRAGEPLLRVRPAKS